MAIKSALGKQLGTQFDSVFDVVKSNSIYDKSGGKIPSLDLNFAKSKSLKDSRSTKNNITFSRASSGQTSKATFVDSNGLIKNTTVNLLRYSEQFNQGYTLQGSTAVTPNQVVAPDGTLTADIISFTSESDRIFQSVQRTGTFTLSVFARVPSGSETFRLLCFNTNESVQSKTITVTDTWQRFSFTATVTTTSVWHPIRFVNSTSEVYLWGAQLEEGTTATDYIPTTSTISGAPRFDHDPATGESLGLLIEEARTNTISNSDNPSGTLIQGTFTRSLESVVSPRGIAEDVRKVEVSSSGGVLRFGPGAGNGAVNTTYSVSFWIKSVDGGTGSINIDINDRNITEVQYTGEWTRITRSGGNRSDVGHQFFDLSQRSSTTDFYIFGAQMEIGSFATSYIPTSGSSVTRAPDIAEITGTDFAKTNLLQYSERFDQNVWNKAKSTITPNVVSAPDGTSTASLFRRTDTSTGNYLGTGISKDTVTKTYTTSVYYKKNDARYASVRMQGNYPSRADAVFDLDTGTLYSINAVTSFTNASASIQDVGNGWYRASMTATTDSHHSVTSYIGCSAEPQFIDQPSSVVNSVYIWGTQLEEGDVLTDYTPSVETFVSRASSEVSSSSATFVDDATGLIKTTPVNLLTRSEEFDNAAWTKDNVTISADIETSPYGTTSADKISETTANSSHQCVQGGAGTSGTTYTASYFAKADGRTSCRISFQGEGSATFNLTTGSVITNAFLSASITPVGNGWFRCVATEIKTNNNPNVYFGPALDDGTISYAGDTSKGIFVWGAQLEEGTTVSPYIKTGSTISGAARFENNQLILEEDRTNRIDRNTSNYNSIWNNATPSGAYNNAGIAPDGTNTAFATTAYAPAVRGQKNYSMPADTNDYTFSIFIKSTGGQGQYITYKTGFHSGNQDTLGQVAYDFATDTVGHGYSRKLYANGWVRIWKTYKNSNKTTFLTTNYKTTSLDMLFWGAQLEKGSYPSSLIITPASANVTRAADVSTSALGVDSFFNQEEGTFFATASKTHSTGSQRVVSNQNSTAGYIVLGQSNNVQCFDGNNASVNTASAYPSFTNAASAYDASTKRVAADGSLSAVVSRQANHPLTPATELRFGPKQGTNEFYGHIKRLTYFNTRLSDDKLKSITT